MQFTPQSLTAAASSFRNVLDHNGLAFPLSKSNDVLALILFGKSYSASMSQARQEGFISVVDLTGEAISEIFKSRSRDVSPARALEIIAKTIEAS